MCWGSAKISIMKRFNPHSRLPLYKRPVIWLLTAVLLTGLLLCMVRNAADDETFYLLDALHISDCLKEGRWIGNETVGFHGFLFKLPAALLFLITGPSVFAATLTTILMGMAAVYLSYLIFLHMLESPKMALAGSFLVCSGVFFLRALSAFLRDNSGICAFLLFIYLILKKKNTCLTGLCLLLLLDTKESLFFTILPGFLLWLLYDAYLRHQKKIRLPFIKSVSTRLAAALLPSVLFLTLMFTTPLVPLNPITAKILHLHQQSRAMYKNIIAPREHRDPKSIFPVESTWENAALPFRPPAMGMTIPAFRDPEIREKLESARDALGSTIGKLFHYRTFSFTSIPRFFIVPAVVMMFLLFSRWKRSGEYEKLILPMVGGIFLLVHWLRSGVGRGILPVAAIIILFFIYFLVEGIKRKKTARNTLIAATAFTAAALFFNPNFPVVKVVLSFIFITWLWAIFYLQHKDKNTPRLSRLKKGIIVATGVFSIITFLGTSYLKPFQLGRWDAWGRHSEMDAVAGQFEKGETLWINYDLPQVQFFRHDRVYSAFREKEHLWDLEKKVPKAATLNRPHRLFTYTFKWKNAAAFREILKQKAVEKVALLVSTHKNKKYAFPLQDRLLHLKSMPFLEPERQVPLKNKILYIFKVKSPGPSIPLSNH